MRGMSYSKGADSGVGNVFEEADDNSTGGWGLDTLPDDPLV